MDAWLRPGFEDTANDPAHLSASDEGVERLKWKCVSKQHFHATTSFSFGI